jgi:hypothetical protein
MTAHRVRHHLRLVSAWIVEARGVNDEEVRHGREGQIDRRSMIATAIRPPMCRPIYGSIWSCVSPNSTALKSAPWSRYFYVVAFQGAMQVVIILIMARFASGL